MTKIVIKNSLFGPIFLRHFQVRTPAPSLYPTRPPGSLAPSTRSAELPNLEMQPGYGSDWGTSVDSVTFLGNKCAVCSVGIDFTTASVVYGWD